jgi:hypothetical protein
VLRQRIERLTSDAVGFYEPPVDATRISEREVDNRRLESAVARLTLENLHLRGVYFRPGLKSTANIRSVDAEAAQKP